MLGVLLTLLKSAVLVCCQQRFAKLLKSMSTPTQLGSATHESMQACAVVKPTIALPLAELVSFLRVQTGVQAV
jgi:hypothetical protein